MLFSLIQNCFLYGILACLYLIFNKWHRRNRIDEFFKRSVFITGADSAIGKLLVSELGRKGLKVYAGCFTEIGVEQLNNDSSDNVKPIRIDVTKRETILAAKEFIEKDLGSNDGLWALVNNVELIRGIVFDFCRVDDYKKVMEVNFFGVVTTTEIFLPLIKKSRGRIINVSSFAGRSSPGLEPYACSKHALDAYCDGLRRSMHTFGVHVATIEPGFFRTHISRVEIWEEEVERTWNQLPADLKEEYGLQYKATVTAHLVDINPKTPFQSWNKLNQVTKSIAHALSSKRPKARYVVGVDARLYVILFTVAPDWILDIPLRKLMRYESVRKNTVRTSQS